MFLATAPTDQRAGVRPIAFTLQTPNGLSTPVTLKIRPEELSVDRPHRTTVTQTLGRGVQGWADHFGEGLPRINMSGNTGWRVAQGSGEDGVQAFHTLNKLINEDYPAAVQNAIDSGQDPRQVKLIYVDMLNDLTWVLVPSAFNLRRSKSRPLLMQFNGQFQCISTDIENPLMILPFSGSIFSGLKALNNVIEKIEGFGQDIEGWIKAAVDAKDAIVKPFADTVREFTATSNRIFRTVNSVIATGKNTINSTANSLIGIAHDVARAGVNLNRTISNIPGITDDIKHAFMRVSGAYQEVVCIFKNSLKPRKTYDNYDGLYGASNCSSTTGGSAASSYINTNVFAKMLDNLQPVQLTSSAAAAVSELGNNDPVLAPKDINELNRLTGEINRGVSFNG